MFFYLWNEEGTPGRKRTSKHRWCRYDRHPPWGKIAGTESCGTAEAGGRHRGWPRRTPRRRPVQRKRAEGLFFPKDQLAMLVVTSAVKLTPVPVNHLRGQRDHDSVCTSNSHYAWKISLIFFNNNRQKVNHVTKMTTSGLTDRTTELLLPSGWSWLHCLHLSAHWQSTRELRRCCCCCWTDSSGTPLLLWEPTSSQRKPSSKSQAGQKDRSLSVWLSK